MPKSLNKNTSCSATLSTTNPTRTHQRLPSDSMYHNLQLQNIVTLILFFGPCIFKIEERTNQENAQINFGLINLLLFNHSDMFRPLNRSHPQGV